jgi:hypothetical protein
MNFKKGYTPDDDITVSKHVAWLLLFQYVIIILY